LPPEREQPILEAISICGFRKGKEMLSRVVVAAVLILVAMVAVQRGVLRDVGIAGSCKAVQSLADGSEWISCSPGRISGRPSLTGKSCTSAGVRGEVEWWHCPAAVVSSAIGR
jgi:hypothetical protein